MVKNSEWANGSQSDQCLHPADYQPTLELEVLVGLSDVFVHVLTCVGVHPVFPVYLLVRI